LPDVPSLGRRGEGWVLLQFVLFAVIAAACAWGPRWSDEVQATLAIIGVVAALAGAAIVAWSARLLEKGRTLTPLPRPPRGGELVEDGPYRVVRHPIYSGALLFFLGLSLALSPFALVPTALLAVLFALKSAVEERFLREAFPAYELYAEQTRWRLAPLLY
jgi:protein-S-isoprenylcysteine O-methyltransferase Ste14